MGVTLRRTLTEMVIKGTAHNFGDDINTDYIIAGRYKFKTLDMDELACHVMEDLDPEFSNRCQEGDFIVAGKNFGCGSSREQAASTLKGYELAIVARGFARIFLQNAINLGLRTIVCPQIEASVGDALEIYEERVVNTTTGKTFPIEPLPKSRQAIIDAGGLIAYTRSRVVAERA